MAAVLAWLRERAANDGDREAVVDGKGRVTFGELQRAAREVADGLRASGVHPGDRVGLLCGNSSGFVAAYLGALESGAVFVPLNPATPAAVLEVMVAETGMRAILVDGAGAPTVRQLAGASTERNSGQTPIPESSAAHGIELVRLSTERAAPTTGDIPADLQTIAYTSGTTGRPKGVMLTAAALAEVARAGCEMLALGPEDRVGIIAPLFHLYALREIDAAIRVGATLVLPSSLTFPAVVLRQLHQERATYISGVPAGFALFVERCAELLAACRDHLRVITLGTAPCPPALAAALGELLPNTRVVLTYGLTEASRVCYKDVRGPDARAGSIGRPYSGVELCTVDASGRTLPTGTPGRIAFRTPMAAAGYWSHPEATRALHLTDGWMLSPDHGHIDADGHLYLRGRVDDVINSGGEKVSPDEVEAALRQHPQVADCAVLSVADPAGRLGEIVLAVIVPAGGAAPDVDELKRFCAGRLELHKVPRDVRIAESLPRTALGKVDRGRLRHAAV